MRIRVIVVDDQALIRAGLVAYLAAQPDCEVLAEAADGAAAVTAAAELAPDVVLMDIRMPGIDGIEATRQIVAASAGAVKVLILTTFDLDEHVYAALRVGASGFLLKDAPPEELLQAIRIVARGDALIAPSITRRLVDSFAARGALTAAAPDTSGLTARERDVLVLIARGLNNPDIAQHLFVSEGTVKTHVHRILTKLGATSRAQLVVAAYEAGLVVPGV